MPTTVVKSIGSAGGRDYSTLQAWNDAAPANLVTADEVWQGQCYNDSEFVSTLVQLTVGGSTTDATHYKELTAASGQSFQDQVGVRTNALTYNTANGVGIRSTNGYGNGSIDIEEDYFRCSRVQCKGDAGDTRTIGGSTFKTGWIFKDLIIHGAQFGQTAPGGGKGLGASATVINVAFLNPQASAATVNSTNTGSSFIACAFVRLTSNSPAGHAVDQAYAGTNTFTMASCAVFGFSDVSQSGSVASGSKNNATDLASFPAGTANQTSVTFNATTPFVQAGSSGTDLRAIASTALATNGFLDATNAPNDISGFTRPANPTIGVWQLASAAVTTGRSYFL